MIEAASTCFRSSCNGEIQLTTPGSLQGVCASSCHRAPLLLVSFAAATDAALAAVLAAAVVFAGVALHTRNVMVVASSSCTIRPGSKVEREDSLACPWGLRHFGVKTNHVALFCCKLGMLGRLSSWS